LAAEGRHAAARRTSAERQGTPHGQGQARKTPAANASQRLERLTRERDEALDQQAATAEVLSVAISGRSQEISFAGFVAGAARVRTVADGAVRDSRHRLGVVVDNNVSRVFFHEIEKRQFPGKLSRLLLSLDVAANRVDRLTECILSECALHVGKFGG